MARLWAGSREAVPDYPVAGGIKPSRTKMAWGTIAGPGSMSIGQEGRNPPFPRGERGTWHHSVATGQGAGVQTGRVTESIQAASAPTRPEPSFS